ncbi:bifunctional DNA primase/polymerase [Thermoplasmatales archaeon AK]|nr:bifunctional DNA primase/polymerase [Thermoplasmatales archaeon AK]
MSSRHDKDFSKVISFLPWQFSDPNIRVIKVRSGGKEAAEQGWQTTQNYSVNSDEIKKWIKKGGNYGITSPLGFYVSVDADTVEIQDALDRDLPKTFRWSTGKPGHFQYGYFVEDGPLGCVPLKEGAYIKGKGGYAVGPGSIHPNGVVYGSVEVRNIPIAAVKKGALLEALSEFIAGRETGNRPNRDIWKGTGQILKVLNSFSIDVSRFVSAGSWLKGPHPIHGSETGTNFAVNPESDCWHCFRHNTGGGVISLIAVLNRLVECEKVGD